MSTRLVCSAFLIATAIGTINAHAQTEVGITAAALASFQPIDDTYVGEPYLSEGVGGIGPGFSAGVNVITASGFAIATEYTTAFYEKEHSGRTVLGGFPLEHVLATTRLRDSYLSVLLGFATSGTTRVVLLGGMSARLGLTTINGEDAERFESGDDEVWPFTGGIDIVRPLASRAQLLISGRYTYNMRSSRLQQLGIGPHVIRGGVGVRIRLN